MTLDIPSLGTVEMARTDVPEGLEPASIDTVGVRPEMLTILFDGPNRAGRAVEAEVVDAVYYGDMTYYDVRLPGAEGTVTISMRNTAGRAVAKPGAKVMVGWGAESVVLFG